MIETPQVIHTEPLHYAAVRRTCPVAEIRPTMDAGIKEVVAAIQAQQRKFTGAWFTHHYCRPIEKFDFEICFPVDSRMDPQGDVYSAIWPAMTVARTVFQGNYSGMASAWGELEKWLHSQNLHGGHEFWERYTINPHDDPTPDHWRTELNWPITG